MSNINKPTIYEPAEPLKTHVLILLITVFCGFNINPWMMLAVTLYQCVVLLIILKYWKGNLVKEGEFFSGTL